VVGATNLSKKIDPAVLRPGRLDKKVFVGPPDLEGRIELVKLYMEDRPQGIIEWLSPQGAQSLPLISKTPWRL
jgi:SpoVK/Ycf46/Vps4 family AAA+-type ATPase